MLSACDLLCSAKTLSSPPGCRLSYDGRVTVLSQETLSRRPVIANRVAELEALMVRLAQENGAWGYNRGVGVPGPRQYLIHGRDSMFCPAFQQIIDAADVKWPPLSDRSPKLNAYAERWVRSVKDEVLPRMLCLARMLFGMCSKSTWTITIRREIIRGRAMCCSFLPVAKVKSVQARFSVANGSTGS